MKVMYAITTIKLAQQGIIEKEAVKKMLRQEQENRNQIEIFCVEEFVP